MTRGLVTLNGFAMNDTLTDGMVWTWQDLEGWFDSADLRIAQSEVSPMGLNTSVARRNGRPLTLTVLAHAVNDSLGLGDLAYKADRTLKGSCELAGGPGLLVVTEPDITLEAYVRAAQPIRRKVFGQNAYVQFQVPLVAPDTRRYNAVASTDASSLQLTASGTSVNHTFTVAGSLSTPPVFTIDGPATNPQVRNDSISALPIVLYNGTLGGADSLVIDLGALTAVLNGTTNVITSMQGTSGGPPEWWQLRPGSNNIRYHRTSGTGTSTAALSYQEAYA